MNITNDMDPQLSDVLSFVKRLESQALQREVEELGLDVREGNIVYNLLSRVRALEENQNRLLRWIEELSLRMDSFAQGHTELYLKILNLEHGTGTVTYQDR